MSTRALLTSAATGFIALSVSGCVSDPYYGYGNYGPVYGGYYAGSAIIYDSGPRIRYRPRYVQHVQPPPRPRPPYQSPMAQRLRYAHPPYSQQQNDVRRLYRAEPVTPSSRSDQLRSRDSVDPQYWRAIRTQDRQRR